MLARYRNREQHGQMETRRVPGGGDNVSSGVGPCPGLGYSELWHASGAGCSAAWLAAGKSHDLEVYSTLRRGAGELQRPWY